MHDPSSLRLIKKLVSLSRKCVSDEEKKKSNKTRKTLFSNLQFHTSLSLSYTEENRRYLKKHGRLSSFKYEINPKFPSFHGSFLTYRLSVTKERDPESIKPKGAQKDDREKRKTNTPKKVETSSHIHTIYDFSNA
jgi:hypothetical protein